MRTRALLVVIGLGVAVGATGGIFAGQLFIWDEATNATVSTTSAAIGGLGSALGGLAAAGAAAISWKSASSSSRAAKDLRQIGADSRLALGRAMKPQLDPQLFLNKKLSSLTLHNAGQWPALDLAVTVDIPGRDLYRADEIGGVEPGGYATAKQLDDLPLPPEPLESWLKRHEIQDWGTLDVHAVLSYSDRDRILRHTDELRYEVTFAYGPNWSMEGAVPSIVRSSEIPL